MQKLQTSIGKYSRQKKKTEKIRNAARAAWKEYEAAGRVFKQELQKLQNSKRKYKKVWKDFETVRKVNDAEINSIRKEADLEHQKMIECYEKADHERNRGNRNKSVSYSREGSEHKRLRDELNAKISEISGITWRKKMESQKEGSFDMEDFYRAEGALKETRAHNEKIQKKLGAEEIRLRFYRDIMEYYMVEHKKITEKIREK